MQENKGTGGRIKRERGEDKKKEGKIKERERCKYLAYLWHESKSRLLHY